MNEPSIVETFGRLCKHICDKKKRQCKFSALRNSDYCVEHLAYNDQVNLKSTYDIFGSDAFI